MCLQCFFQQTQTKFKGLENSTAIRCTKAKISHAHYFTLALNCLQEVKCWTGKYICLWPHLIHVSRKELKSYPQWSTYIDQGEDTAAYRMSSSCNLLPASLWWQSAIQVKEILEKGYNAFLPSTDRSVLDGKRTTLHPLWFTALNHLVGKQEILPELFKKRWHAFSIFVPSPAGTRRRLLLITVHSSQVLAPGMASLMNQPSRSWLPATPKAYSK